MGLREARDAIPVASGPDIEGVGKGIGAAGAAAGAAAGGRGTLVLRRRIRGSAAVPSSLAAAN